MTPPPRDCRSTTAFENQRLKIEPNCKRFDEYFRAVEWALVRIPHNGRYQVTSTTTEGLPAILIEATVEDTIVTLTSIAVVDAPL